MVHLFVVSGYVTSYVFFCTAFGFASLLKSVANSATVASSTIGCNQHHRHRQHRRCSQHPDCHCRSQYLHPANVANVSIATIVAITSIATVVANNFVLP